MNTITLTIAATPDNLKRLAAAFGDCIDETLPGNAVPAHRISADRDPEKNKPVIKSAEIQASPLPEMPENGAKEPENGAKCEITQSVLRNLGLGLLHKGKNKEIKEILKEYGVPKLTELPEEHYAAVYERLEALA